MKNVNQMNQMNQNKIPKCKEYKHWTPNGYEYDCEYDTDIVCDNCICITAAFNDFTGIDPRTNKPFKRNER